MIRFFFPETCGMNEGKKTKLLNEMRGKQERNGSVLSESQNSGS